MIINGIFTSESVSDGHPDKICDQMSDLVIDFLLQKDKFARVACETLIGNGFGVVTGEVSGNFDIEELKNQIPSMFKDLLQKKIGYSDQSLGFNLDDFEVIVRLNHQSEDIALGVDLDGAGDQGLMFGFAIKETPQLMPLPIILAHEILKELKKIRHQKYSDSIFPDAKSQVSIHYENGKAVDIDTIVLSSQHHTSMSEKALEEILKKEVIAPVLSRFHFALPQRVFINPTGRFVIGGPISDVGLTGRKIIVDTYGGYARHGGGAFSGKDGTKVDRSAAYMARCIAKHVVGCDLADVCEIQLSYAIGKKEPTSIYVNSFGTGKMDDSLLAKKIEEIFPLSPLGIIEFLELRTPFYSQFSTFGHFGREELNLSWENLKLKEAVSSIL